MLENIPFVSFFLNLITCLRLTYRPGPPQQGFRRKGDPCYLIRFKQVLGKEYIKIASDCEIAGVSHWPKSWAMKAFARGRYRRIELVRDPNNRFDPDAVKVFGVWRGIYFHYRRQIGFIPARYAERIAEFPHDMKLAGTLKTIFLPRFGKSAGGRIQIWIR